MDWQTAVRERGRLWRKWISGSTEGISTDRIQESILRELRAARTGKIQTSVGLRREMAGELILCGKIRKALAG